jgi:hypothetical protein
MKSNIAQADSQRFTQIQRNLARNAMTENNSKAGAYEKR